MNVLVYLVPLALMLGLTGLFAFLWSLKRGQMEDLEGAGWRAISDDDLPEKAEKPSAPAAPARQPATRQPATRKPATRKPATRKPATRKPATRETATSQL